LKITRQGPLLIGYLCASLLRGSAEKVSFAPSEYCRQQCSALVYGIKSTTLYLLAQRASLRRAPPHISTLSANSVLQFPDASSDGTQGPSPAPPPPTPPSAAFSSAPLQLDEAISDAGSATTTGDLAERIRSVCGSGELSAEALGGQSKSVSVFELIVSTTSIARANQDSDSTRSQDFEEAPAALHAVAFKGKIFFKETPYIAWLTAMDKFEKALNDLVSKYLTFPGGHGLLSEIYYRDNQDLRKPLLFGTMPENISQRATLDLADIIFSLHKRHPIPGIEHLMKELVKLAGVVLFLDLGIGPRSTEYVALMAQLGTSFARTVSISALDGLVRLHFRSLKNQKTDIAFLTPQLSKLFIRFLALFRPFAAVLLVPAKSADWACLLPGLTGEALRQAIEQHLDTVNVAGATVRERNGRLPFNPGAVRGIGPSIFRQAMHYFLHRICPADFAAELELFRDVLAGDRSTTQMSFVALPAFELYTYGMVLPRIVGTLAIHSDETASRAYGRSGQQLSTADAQIPALRNFSRAVLKKTALLADREVGGGRLDQCTYSRPAVGVASQLVPMLLSQSSPLLSASRIRSSPEPDSAIPAELQARRLQQDVLQLNKRPRRIELEEQRAIASLENILRLRYPDPQRPLYLSNEQRLLVELTAKGVSTLAIMPTGSGKTLAVTAFALAHPDCVSLLVLPLLGLEQDMVSRLEEALTANLPQRVLRFDPRMVDTWLLPKGAASTVRIIIVSVEHLMSDAFSSFMTRLEQEHDRHLRRMFLDEAHQLLPSASFREAFIGLGSKIARYGAPIVAFTATASPRLEKAMLKFLYCDQPGVQVIAKRTLRENIRYEVVASRRSGSAALDASGDAAVMNEFVRNVADVYLDPQWEVAGKRMQLLIYTWRCELCDSVQNALATHFDSIPQPVIVGVYHGRLDDAVRTATLKNVKSGAIHILVATEAGGCGLDLSNVAVVFHHCFPSTSLGSFQQQLGRAARPGCPKKSGLSRVFYIEQELIKFEDTLRSDSNSRAATLARDLDIPSPLEEVALVRQYAQLAGGDCRRKWLGVHSFDPEARSCDDMETGFVHDVARCDLCCPTLQSHNAAQSAALLCEQRQAGSMELERYIVQAEQMFTEKICICCSIVHAELIPYPNGGLATSCRHSTAFQLGRCYNCSEPGHIGRECKVVETAVNRKRCFVCLRRGCNPSLHPAKRSILGMAALALEHLHQPDFLSDEQLAEILPAVFPELSELPDGTKLGTLRKKEEKEALRGILLADCYYDSPECWAQVFLGLASKLISAAGKKK
jgi:superfamily II DNA helicase RecQ